MCFSAPASFTASAVLATIGTALICRTKTKRLLALAVIPWFFAIQQLAEGFVWLHLAEMPPSLFALGAKNVFLFFAYVFWPVWVPFALWLAEDHPFRKQTLAICLGIGVVLVCFLGFSIPYITASPHHCSIRYILEFKDENLLFHSQLYYVSLFFYGITVLAPLFISSLKKMWTMGVLVAMAGFITYGIDRFFFTSMWCFFAALISIGFFFLLPQSDRRKKSRS